MDQNINKRDLFSSFKIKNSTSSTTDLLSSETSNLHRTLAENEMVKRRQSNISIAILKGKQNSVGDPMTQFGIMTLNNHIPYKRPVLKLMPCFVNARGVLQELKDKHGGIYATKTDQMNEGLGGNNTNSSTTNGSRPKSGGGPNSRLSSAIVNGRV